VTSPTEPPDAPQGRIVRSTSRPGLTGSGVALLGGGVGIVASVIAELLTDGLGWVFSIPFILVCVYCAAEVSKASLRSAVVMPSLAILAVALVNPIFAQNIGGLRGWTVKTLTALTTLAPTLMIATGLAAAIVGYRYWRTTHP
jgi:hypothetical protein